uniref:Uncharacterized protein n=1 Tax=Arion vulgaris TaxID=1028688 RepID=A0A0B6ZSB8_9EUPU
MSRWERGKLRRSWVQHVIEDLSMTAADNRHLMEDKEAFRADVVGAKFRNNVHTKNKKLNLCIESVDSTTDNYG